MKETALITGASGEIGGAIARSLAAEGFNIAAGYAHNLEAAEQLAQKLKKSFGISAAAVKTDLSDLQSIPRALGEVESLLGSPSVLVNNGGCESIGLFQDISDERLAEIMNADLIGAVLLTKHILPDMIRAHRGCIVNIASVWGEIGASCEVAYSAAKAGLIGFTKALAKECAPSGISVNCVSPGFIDTRMNSQLSDSERRELIDSIPCCRAGMPQDVANAVAFLVSGKADYICGQVIRVDGGWI